MKKLIFSNVFILAVTVLGAQSLEQANQHLYYERYASAENVFHQVLHSNPNNAEAWVGLTEAYLLQNEVGKLNDSIAKAPSSVQSEPYYKVAQGSLLLQKNNVAEANNLFKEALDDTKEKDAGVLAAVAEAHIDAKGGDANYAIELLNKAIKRNKKDASLYVLLGDAYRNLNNGTEAFKAYQQAIERNDKYAEAYHKTGEIFLTQKNAELYTEYFKKALAADPDYAPSLYQLYVYEFYRNPVKAMEYYKEYVSKSDASIQNEYDLADLLYINKQYSTAVEKANNIINKEGEKAKPRLYKLIGYSYAGQRDTARAITYMQQYFAKEVDSNFIAKDYTSMGDFYSSQTGQDSLAMVYYGMALDKETDSSVLYEGYKKMAQLNKERKDFASEAKWLGKFYTGNEKASNLDLFYWGIAHYKAENYPMADSVFAMYVAKYPEQGFGYYWQAKSKALQDKEMAQGLAVPVYEKLIEVLQKDTADANYKKWTVEAYGYIAAYKVNTEKNFQAAIDYFNKILAIDPENADAKKYIAMLEKNLADKNR
jgi:tetratricopeptide (TPR) repeat protein